MPDETLGAKADTGNAGLAQTGANRPPNPASRGVSSVPVVLPPGHGATITAIGTATGTATGQNFFEGSGDAHEFCG